MIHFNTTPYHIVYDPSDGKIFCTISNINSNMCPSEHLTSPLILLNEICEFWSASFLFYLNIRIVHSAQINLSFFLFYYSNSIFTRCEQNSERLMPNKICVYKKSIFFILFEAFKETHHTPRERASENTQKTPSLRRCSLCVYARADRIGSDRKLYISHRTHAKVIYSWRADLRVNLDLGAFFVQFLLVKFLLQINALYGFNELRLHTCAPTKICEVYRWRARRYIWDLKINWNASTNLWIMYVCDVYVCVYYQY